MTEKTTNVSNEKEFQQFFERGHNAATDLLLLNMSPASELKLN